LRNFAIMQGEDVRDAEYVELLTDRCIKM
jgi:hypothetical protein